MHGSSNSIFTENRGNASRLRITFENEFFSLFSFLSNDLVDRSSPRDHSRAQRRIDSTRGGDTREPRNGVARNNQNESRLERFRFEGIKSDLIADVRLHGVFSRRPASNHGSSSPRRSKFRQQDGSWFELIKRSESFFDFSLHAYILPIFSLRINTFFFEGKIPFWRLREIFQSIDPSCFRFKTRWDLATSTYEYDLHRSNTISKLNFDDG